MLKCSKPNSRFGSICAQILRVNVDITEEKYLLDHKYDADMLLNGVFCSRAGAGCSGNAHHCALPSPPTSPAGFKFCPPPPQCALLLERPCTTEPCRSSTGERVRCAALRWSHFHSAASHGDVSLEGFALTTNCGFLEQGEFFSVQETFFLTTSASTEQMSYFRSGSQRNSFSSFTIHWNRPLALWSAIIDPDRPVSARSEPESFLWPALSRIPLPAHGSLSRVRISRPDALRGAHGDRRHTEGSVPRRRCAETGSLSRLCLICGIWVFIRPSCFQSGLLFGWICLTGCWAPVVPLGQTPGLFFCVHVLNLT